MITRRLPAVQFRRYLSHELKESNKRFIQTTPTSTRTSSNSFYNFQHEKTREPQLLDRNSGSKWAKHSLEFPSQPISAPKEANEESQSSKAPVRRSRTSRFKTFNNLTSVQPSTLKTANSTPFKKPSSETSSPSQVIEITSDPAVQAASSSIQKKPKPLTTETIPKTNTAPSTPKKKRTLRPRKALITLSSNAVSHLQALLDQPEPKLIRIGVRNRGCSGLTYNLEYVDKPGKFDETVEQDGVKVLIDSKALFSIVGSEMDWLDDKLSSRFIFKNPNSKGTCGCGESFMV
ncbi:ISA1 [Candida theae]|uniref:Iron-sulfur assembly protein 1 n=1 Tax=Candida theae TaxID=1198502 RepID=A0AAD5BGC2_9ASCO|nr:ISA1 [Candida theae]KAI5959216.1 ISA1 [Candida theae]